MTDSYWPNRDSYMDHSALRTQLSERTKSAAAIVRCGYVENKILY